MIDTKLRDYPLEQETVQITDDTTISYFIGGDEAGQPIVLLHGGGTDHALLSWRDTIPYLLDKGYRIYAPNYPGYGASPLNNKPSTMNNLIGYLEALIEIWKIEKVNLVGISMGGALSIGYTLQNPNHVQSLTLVGSYGIQDYAPAHHMSYFLVRMPWLLDASWRMMRGSRWAAKYTLSNIVHNPEARTDDVIDELMEALANPDSQKAFSQWQRDEVQWEGLKTNYSEQLHRIEQPVLMVHGTHDVGVPLKYAQRAVTKFQKAQLEIFENAGHWTQRDFPDKFNHLLEEFLSNISAS